MKMMTILIHSLHTERNNRKKGATQDDALFQSILSIQRETTGGGEK